MKVRSSLRTPDIPLLVMVILLVLFGSIMIGSANGWTYSSKDPSLDPLMIRQILGLLMGCAIIFGLFFVDDDTLKFSAVPLYGVSLLLLLLVLRFGAGASDDDEVRRWLTVFGSFSLQPSELTKVVLILAYGWFFDRFQKQISHPIVILGAGALALLPLFLVFKEPDLSTSLVLLAIAFTCVLVAGVNRWVILSVFAVMGLGFYILFTDAVSETPRFLSEYQVNRILAWLHPEDYSLTLAYQSIRSRMAIGSGGLLGKGLFHNAGLVPIATTDFIFGIIGEELGLIGGSFILLWIFLISGRILTFALLSRDLFHRIIYAGTAVMIAFQSLVHIGVNLAVLPNTGIPLPFVSYGLSSLTANMAAIGLVIRLRSEEGIISRRRIRK